MRAVIRAFDSAFRLHPYPFPGFPAPPTEILTRRFKPSARLLLYHADLRLKH
jgi:hypothetical protein